MTALSQRRSKLAFSTSDLIRERGRYREVIVEAEPQFAVLRLKGTKHRLTVSWAGLYAYAARAEADRIIREKKAAKKAKEAR